MKSSICQILFSTVMLAFVSSTFADGDAVANEKEPVLGRWTFSAGPAWRGDAKMKISGTAHANMLRNSSESTVTDPQNSADWNLETVPSPIASDPDPVWSTVNTREYYSSKAGSGSVSLDSSDEDAPRGVNLQAGYDFWQSKSFSAGINVRFASYNEIETTCAGTIASSRVRTQIYADHYYFLDDLWTGDPEIDLDWAPDGSKPQKNSYKTDVIKDTGWQTVRDGRTVYSRFRSELCQIGVGPKATWHALSWLDIYGGGEILFNYSRNRFEADGMSASDSDHPFGFGVSAGFMCNIFECFGIYGQAGYEWIDKSKLSVGDFNSEIDYSSRVFSAGMQLRF